MSGFLMMRISMLINNMLDFIPRVPPKPFKLEKEFQYWIGQCIEDHHGLWWPYHKMSDQAIIQKPCDCFYVDSDGRTCFMELKTIDSYTLNLKKFEPQQVEFLSKVSSLQEKGPLAMTYALAVVYSKKLHRWEVFHWNEIEEELMEKGSIKLFQ